MEKEQFYVKLSDVTLKKNVADWTEDATTILKAFNPRTFNWIGDPDGPPYEIGWIAQEGQPHIPQMFPNFPNTSLLIVDTREFSVYAHKAILELDLRAIALETGIGEVYTKTESDARYVNLTGPQTIGGIKVFTNPVNFVDLTTEISRDGSNNMIFTDAITGTKTLAELAMGGGGMTVIEIDIGTWNMDNDSTKTIAHGQANKEAIKSACATVRNDNGDRFYQMCGADSGYIYWTDTHVVMRRPNWANNTAFNSTSFSRGTLYLTLSY